MYRIDKQQILKRIWNMYYKIPRTHTINPYYRQEKALSRWRQYDVIRLYSSSPRAFIYLTKNLKRMWNLIIILRWLYISWNLFRFLYTTLFITVDVTLNYAICIFLIQEKISILSILNKRVLILFKKLIRLYDFFSLYPSKL